MSDLRGAQELLRIVNERIPQEPEGGRHGLCIMDGHLALIVWYAPGRWQSFFLNEMGDLDKDPEQVAEDVFRLIADMGHTLPGATPLRLVYDVDKENRDGRS